MDFILTLIASNQNLSNEHITKIECFLNSCAMTITARPIWLTRDIACDIYISRSLTMDQMFVLRNILKTDKIDIFCIKASKRRKKLLLADMDSTIVSSETLDELSLIHI